MKILWHIFYLLIILSFTSCSNPFNKSVLVPLTVSDYNKLLKEDSSFARTYSVVVNSNNFVTQQDSSLFYPLTYKKFHFYLKYIQSVDKHVTDSLFKVWNDKYFKYNAQTDSLISIWDKYLVDNSIDSLVRISYKGIKFDKFKNLSGKIEQMPKLSLSIKALKGNIDSLVFFYSLCKKGESPVYIYFYNGEMNFLKYKKKITDSVDTKIYPYLPENVINELQISDSLYVLKYFVNSLYVDGKNHIIDSLKNDLPYLFLKLYEDDGGSLLSNSYTNIDVRDSIMVEYIDNRFELQGDYIISEKERIFSNYDPLSYEFLMKGKVKAKE